MWWLCMKRIRIHWCTLIQTLLAWMYAWIRMHWCTLIQTLLAWMYAWIRMHWCTLIQTLFVWLYAWIRIWGGEDSWPSPCLSCSFNLSTSSTEDGEWPDSNRPVISSLVSSETSRWRIESAQCTGWLCSLLMTQTKKRPPSKWGSFDLWERENNVPQWSWNPLFTLPQICQSCYQQNVYHQ